MSLETKKQGDIEKFLLELKEVFETTDDKEKVLKNFLNNNFGIKNINTNDLDELLLKIEADINNFKFYKQETHLNYDISNIEKIIKKLEEKSLLFDKKNGEIKDKIISFIENILNDDKNSITNSFEYGKLRNGKILKHLIKSLETELSIDKLDIDNIKIHQLVEKKIDENFDFVGLRILFTNNEGNEIVRNISITINKQGDIRDIHISMPKRLVNNSPEDLKKRNTDDILVSDENKSDIGIEIENIDNPKEISIDMIKNHWGKFLLEGKDSVLKIFEPNAILKGTLDNTYSTGEDLADYFEHFCHMSPELTLLEDSIKAEWLTNGETIKASGNYIFNVGEESNKIPVNGNFTFIIKKNNNSGKWAFSVLHSSIENNAYELKQLK